MAFTVAYTHVAAEEFQALPRRVKHQVRAAVATLAGDPRGVAAADCLKGDWEGDRRLRIGRISRTPRHALAAASLVSQTSSA